MMTNRFWSFSLCVLMATGLAMAGCTQSEPEKEAPAPAAKPAGQPPAAAKPAAAPAYVIDELYVDSEAEPDEGEPPLTSKFITTVEDQTGKVECRWDFGDGSPEETGLNPTHIYKEEGDFIAVVVCKDEKGIEGETEVDITVYTYE